jgi:DNA recombination protein RmuC
MLQNIDTNILIFGGAIAGVFLLLLAGLIFALLRTQRGQAELRMELTARLAQIADGQGTAQSTLVQRLADHERAVSARLDTVGLRVGQSLEASTNQTKESLSALRERLAVMDEAQKNITELSTQMVGLQDILSNKQARGAFGEIQLQDLVEAILPPNTFTFQATVGDGKRVDCLIHLPNPPGPIAIDAKFPLESYQRLSNAETDADKLAAARDFSRDVLTHVRAIKEKYIVPGETAEAALMFLPSEAIYAEIHARYANIVEQSFRERVYIVSPTTLWATLNTVRAVFKDVRMREAAHLIQKELHTMLDDVGRLDKRVGNLEQHFTSARKDIDEIRTSTGKITRRAERIQELEVGDLPADDAAEALGLPPTDASRAA